MVFVFPGQGSQWAGMGAELARSSPVFAGRLAECGAALAPYVDWDLLEVLAGAGGAPGLEAAEVVQPALWAVMVSLAAVWQAAGVSPDAVVGHSQGEIAAATVAGILPLADAARVVAVRSRALSGLGGAGGMVSVVMPEAAVRELLARWPGRLSVAAVNGPAATVVSGDPAALGEFEAELSARHVLRWPVPASDFVAHSAAVQGLAGALAEGLAGLDPQPGQVPMFSTVHSRWVQGTRTRRRLLVRQRPGAGPVRGSDPGPGRLTASEPSSRCRRIRRWKPRSGTRSRGRRGARPGYQRDAAPGQRRGGAGAVGDGPGLGPGRAGELGRGARPRAAGRPADVRLPAPAVLAAGRAARAARDPGRRRRGGHGREARFWAAVEGGDAAGLAELVAVDGERPFAEVLPALASWRRREQEQSVTKAGGTGSRGRRCRTRTRPALTGTWLVVVPAGPRPGRPGAGCVRGAGAAATAPRCAVEAAAGAGREELAALVSRAARAGGPGVGLAGIVSLLALDESPLAGEPSVPAGLAGTLALVQALGDAGTGAPLWTVTCGAVATGPGEALASPVQAQAWGLGRVAALECAERWGGLVDVPPVLDERTAERLAAVLAGCGEDQAAVRGAGILGRRLARAAAPRGAGAWVPGGTVLVTGGTGAIGGHAARLLAGRGAPRVVLAGRSGPAAPGAAALAAELAAAGTAAQVTACDAADRAQVSGLLERIAGSGPPLAGVLHAAGTLDDGLLDGLDPARLASVLAAKAAGAAHLDELTRGLGLERFVLFSSAAAVFGGAGQGNYAAANAFLDALAEQRAAAGLPGLSVAWGPWAGGGVAQASEAVRQRLRRGPLAEMDPARATAALALAVDGHDTTLAVMDVDWAQFAAAPAPLVADLPDVARLAAAARATGAPAGGPPGGAAAGLAARLAGLPRAEQARQLTELIRAGAAAVLGHDSPDAIDPERAFSDLGFDSLTTLEMRQHVTAATGLRLPSTLLFDYPTPAVLAAFLRTRSLGDPAGRRDAPRPSPRPPRRRPGSRSRSWGWAAGSPAG